MCKYLFTHVRTHWFEAAARWCNPEAVMRSAYHGVELCVTI